MKLFINVLKALTICITGLVLFSCTKDNDEPGMGEVKFAITSKNINSGKTEDISPIKLLVRVENTAGEEVIDETLLLVQFGDGYISADAIELVAGNYKLTEFLVIGDEEGDEKVIYAAPVEGSERAYLVKEEERLPLTFSLLSSEVTIITPTVLEVYADHDPGSFGYGFGSFTFNVLETFELNLAALSGVDSTYLPFDITINGYDLDDTQLINETISTNGSEISVFEFSSDMAYYAFEIDQEGYHPLTHYYHTIDLMEETELPFFLYNVESIEAISANELFIDLDVLPQPVIAYIPKEGCSNQFSIDFGGYNHSGVSLLVEIRRDNSIGDLLEHYAAHYNHAPDYLEYPILGSIQLVSLSNTFDFCDKYPEENTVVSKFITVDRGQYQLLISTVWDNGSGQWVEVSQQVYDNENLVFEQTYSW